MSEWISVKDRLPEEGDLILILLDDRKCCTDKILCLGGKYIFPQRVSRYARLQPSMNPMFLDDNYYSYNPTHWQPLPNPPEDK